MNVYPSYYLTILAFDVALFGQQVFIFTASHSALKLISFFLTIRFPEDF